MSIDFFEATHELTKLTDKLYVRNRTSDLNIFHSD